MNKELIDKAWACLPREFREEVKRLYREFTFTREGYYAELFGIHNLTSDAEGEEMLTVPRKRVMEIYNHCNGGGAQVIEDIFGKLTYDMNNDGIITPLDKFKGLPHLNEKQEVITDYEGYAPTLYPYEGQWFISWISSEGDSILDFQAESPEKAIELAYNHLFGSKCLPDESNMSEILTGSEPKPAEPKFKVGDEAFYVCSPTLKHKCTVTKVMQNEHSDKWEYNVMFEWGKPGMWIPESDLEPYTEPQPATERSNLNKESSTCTDDCSCQDHFVVNNEMVDRIIKDSFSKERRLNIAAMAMQGLLSNTTRFSSYEISDLVRISLNCADALIAESEKGGLQ